MRNRPNPLWVFLLAGAVALSAGAAAERENDRTGGSLVDAEARDGMVDALVESLRTDVRTVSAVEEIPAAILEAGVLPALSPISSEGTGLSIARREVTDGDVYYVFNESYEARTESLRVTEAFEAVTLLDPDTGESQPVSLDGDVLTLSLEASRGVVLFVER